MGKKVALLFILLFVSVSTQAADFSDAYFSFGASLGSGYVKSEQPELQTDNAYFTGLRLGIDYPINRLFGFETSLNSMFANFGSSGEISLGQHLKRLSLDSGFFYRLPIGADFQASFGSGLGVGYVWSTDRYTELNGFLNQKFDDDSGLQYSVFFEIPFEYFYRSQRSFVISPKYEFAITGLNAFSMSFQAKF